MIASGAVADLEILGEQVEREIERHAEHRGDRARQPAQVGLQPVHDRADPVGDRHDGVGRIVHRPGQAVAQQEQRPARRPAPRPRSTSQVWTGRGLGARGVRRRRVMAALPPRLDAGQQIDHRLRRDLADRLAGAVDHRERLAGRDDARRRSWRSCASGATVPPCSAPSQAPHQAARRDDLGALHVAGELGDVVGRRIDDQLLRRADLDDLAILHDGDAVGQPDRLVEIMGDEDDGLVQHVLQPHQLVLHLAADQRIERRERLVEEPDFRLGREAAGDADALLLAAGQFARIEMLAAAQADQLDHLARPLLARRPVDALDAQAERRCSRARSDAAAAQNSGTPCPCGDGAARSARRRRSSAGPCPRTRPCRRSARPAATCSAPASTCRSPTGP